MNTENHSEKKSLLYEEILMQDAEIPVNVFMHRNNSENGGCEFHWHEELEFYYVLEGGVNLLCHGTRQWLYAGDVGFVNWCEPHCGCGFLDGTRHYIIQIGTELFAKEMVTLHTGAESEPEKYELLSLLLSQNSDFPTVLRGNRELVQYLDIIIAEEQDKEPGYQIRIKAAVYNILVLLLRSARLSPKTHQLPAQALSLDHLRRILAYISGHCTDPEEISLPALSKKFGLSVPYLCRIFKKHTDMTITAYINKLRCFRAASFIQDGMPLEEAASLTGFHDYNYFSRIFKKIMKVSPSAYRKKSFPPNQK